MYDELFEMWRREVENPSLQPLPRDFYARLADYIHRIREERRMIDEESIRGRLLRMEEENAKNMIDSLARLRREKIIRMVEGGGSIPPNSLTEEEESLYSGLVANKEAFESLLENIMLGQRPRVRRARTGLLVVRILKELPQIVGADMRLYGPFKPEDIATLPEENARALIRQGAALEINVQ